MGHAAVQIRFINAEGVAKATDIVPITVDRILQPGVIKYQLHKLKNLAVTPPNKSDYAPGDLMDWTGVQVTARYTDGVAEDVTAACTYSPENGTTMTEIMIARGAQLTYSEGGVTLYYMIALEEIL